MIYLPSGSSCKLLPESLPLASCEGSLGTAAFPETVGPGVALPDGPGLAPLPPAPYAGEAISPMQGALEQEHQAPGNEEERPTAAPGEDTEHISSQSAPTRTTQNELRTAREKRHR